MTLHFRDEDTIGGHDDIRGEDGSLREISVVAIIHLNLEYVWLEFGMELVYPLGDESHGADYERATGPVLAAAGFVGISLGSQGMTRLLIIDIRADQSNRHDCLP